jgi:hypothetical protein
MTPTEAIVSLLQETLQSLPENGMEKSEISKADPQAETSTSGLEEGPHFTVPWEKPILDREQNYFVINRRPIKADLLPW